MGYAYVFWIYNDAISCAEFSDEDWARLRQPIGEAVLKLTLRPETLITKDGLKRDKYANIGGHYGALQLCNKVHATDEVVYLWSGNCLRPISDLDSDELNKAASYLATRNKEIQEASTRSARIAYLTLVKGRLPGQNKWESTHKQHAAMFWPLARLQMSDLFNPEELNNILIARRYVRNIETQIIDGCTCFGSVYDLMLHLELDLESGIEGRPKHIYRGHQEYGWGLVPSLYREPDKIDSEIEKAISMISDLLDREPNFLTYTPLEILAVAQHYGAKTCLLDFTYEPTIAATFACMGYKLDFDEKYGAIYYFSEDEAKSYCQGMDLATGSVISVELSGIPRIERQKGLFIGAFNKDALKSVLSTDRYIFLHGIDSLTFPSDTGLTQKYLFPKEWNTPNIIKQEPQKRKRVKKQILDEIQSMLYQWAVKFTSNLSWEECYNIGLRFVRDRSSLNEEQLRRLRVFCKWFADLQKLSLPGDIKSMTSLRWATSFIENYYQVSNETKDIINRLDRAPNQGVIREVLDLLNIARKTEGYGPIT